MTRGCLVVMALLGTLCAFAFVRRGEGIRRSELATLRESAEPMRVPHIGRHVVVADSDAEPIPPARDHLVVGTPGCGASERQLSLPERREILDEDEETVRDILEALRVSIADRVTDGATSSTEDDVYSCDGVMTYVRRSWRALDASGRARVLDLLRTGAASTHPLVRAIREIENQNRIALAELANVLGAQEAAKLWSGEVLTWCGVALEAGMAQ